MMMMMVVVVAREIERYVLILVTAFYVCVLVSLKLKRMKDEVQVTK